MNLWNLAISDTSFNIVDIKPTNMEELTEVITAASCHPEQVLFFYFYLFIIKPTNMEGLTDVITAARCHPEEQVLSNSTPCFCTPKSIFKLVWRNANHFFCTFSF